MRGPRRYNESRQGKLFYLELQLQCTGKTTTVCTKYSQHKLKTGSWSVRRVLKNWGFRPVFSPAPSVFGLHSHIYAINWNECNVIIPRKNDGQNFKNNTQVVISWNYLLSLKKQGWENLSDMSSRARYVVGKHLDSCVDACSRAHNLTPNCSNELRVCNCEARYF